MNNKSTKKLTVWMCVKEGIAAFGFIVSVVIIYFVIMLAAVKIIELFNVTISFALAISLDIGSVAVAVVISFFVLMPKLRKVLNLEKMIFIPPEVVSTEVEQKQR